MLRFFSSIRQRQLKENKLRSYLLYAIGEIILVVLGILIALQINNWSEARNESKDEVELLSNIRTNLESDIEQLQNIQKRTRNRLIRLDSTVNMLKTPGKINKNQFLNQAFAFSLDSYFICNSSIFDEAISSGKMSLVKDKALLENIFAYYQDAKENLQDRTTRMVTDEMITPKLLELVYLNKDAMLNRKSPAADFAGMEALDLYELRKNKAFWNMYFTKQGYNEFQINNWKGHEKEASALIKQISAFLK